MVLHRKAASRDGSGEGMTNGREHQTVIFLGAGASATDSAPIQSELFREYFQLRRSINEGVRRHDAGHDLAEFFRTFFGIAVETTPLDEVEFPTFEEVLGILELAESEDESRPRKTSPEASPRRRGRASWSVRGRVGPSELALRKPDPRPPRCWRKAGALPVTKCHET